jgi:hypothetical protein
LACKGDHLSPATPLARAARAPPGGLLGAFRGVQVPESDSEEALDDLPFVERLFHYLRGSGYHEMPTTCTGGKPAKPQGQTQRQTQGQSRVNPGTTPRASKRKIRAAVKIVGRLIDDSVCRADV